LLASSLELLSVGLICFNALLPLIWNFRASEKSDEPVSKDGLSPAGLAVYIGVMRVCPIRFRRPLCLRSLMLFYLSLIINRLLSHPCLLLKRKIISLSTQPSSSMTHLRIPQSAWRRTATDLA
jgi:hypothetical protein